MARECLAVLAATILAGCFGSNPVGPVERQPPLGPTVFIDPDIVTDADPTTLDSVDPTGTGQRSMFDQRADGFVTVEAHLFDATFDDGLSVEVQVNPEFTEAEALAVAEKYAESIGRLPTALRRDVASVWIHRGAVLFDGVGQSVLIHTELADEYEAAGVLEEVLIHQAAHASLDAAHANAAGWMAAQVEDDVFISQLAEDSPTGEDIAESMVPYIAARYRTDRITDFLEALILDAIPARIAYLDGLALDMYPLTN